VQELPDGIVFESRLANCSGGPAEHDVGRIVDGSQNRFLVRYSVRGSVVMTAERRAEWLDKLASLQLLRM